MRSGPSISRICNELAMQMHPVREETAPDISPTTLPIGQQLALLAMRRSKLSLACHDEIKRRDGLRAARLAIRNPETGYHDLTPRGRWKALRTITGASVIRGGRDFPETETATSGRR